MSESANAKKNAKKKQKKNSAEQTTSETSALEQAIKQHNPNAELIQDGWVEVKDVKKEKFQQRVLKKKQAVEAKTAADNAETDHVTATVTAVESPKAAKKKRRAAPDEQNQKKKGPDQPSKKKKSGKAADVKRPNNDSELVALIKNIINSHPQRFLNIATIGDRIQALTKCAWNKTFKPQFGNLKDFVANHPDDFHHDPNLDRTYLKQEWDQQTAEKARHQAEQNARKAAKNRKGGEAGADQPRARRENGVKQASGQSSSVVLKLIALVGLVAGLVFLTALAVNGFDVHAVISQARSLLS
jgi:hypothetical protein